MHASNILSLKKKIKKLRTKLTASCCSGRDPVEEPLCMNTWSLRAKTRGKGGILPTSSCLFQRAPCSAVPVHCLPLLEHHFFCRGSAMVSSERCSVDGPSLLVLFDLPQLPLVQRAGQMLTCRRVFAWASTPVTQALLTALDSLS